MGSTAGYLTTLATLGKYLPHNCLTTQLTLPLESEVPSRDVYVPKVLTSYLNSSGLEVPQPHQAAAIFAEREGDR